MMVGAGFRWGDGASGARPGGPGLRKGGPYAAIYAVVKRIPRGRVATYGQIASLAGMAGHARQVGYALHHLPGGSRVPWHRVINARGRISFHPSSMEWAVQRALLEAEGIAVSMDRGISLARVQWRPSG